MAVDGVGNNYGNSRYTPPSEKTGGSNIDAIYEDPKDKQVSVDDFLQLMITQLKNQDFMNPMDDTQYVTQMAQFATMQQMQELAYYSTSNYAMSLVGKDLTVAKLSVGGDVEKITGPVEKIAFLDQKFKVFVKGNAYDLNQIMEVHSGAAPGTSLDTQKYSVIPTTKTDTSIDIEWPPPTEDPAIASKLKYSVYYSTSSDFSSVSEVKKGTLVGTAEREDLYAESITGLEPDTTYFINVVVKDGEGKETVYTKTVVSTLKTPETK